MSFFALSTPHGKGQHMRKTGEVKAQAGSNLRYGGVWQHRSGCQQHMLYCGIIQIQLVQHLQQMMSAKASHIAFQATPFDPNAHYLRHAPIPAWLS